MNQPYDKIPYTNGKPKKQSENTKTSQTSITQRLRTDLGLSVK